jgi:dihydrolipoamide dehydrogenase
MPDRFDVVVIGAGPGGYVAAIRAAQLGMKVACVEKSRTLGGTCLNVGCIPSKALLDSSELYHLAKHRFEHHGIKVGDVILDLPRMLTRKDGIVKSLTDGVAFLLKKNNITHYSGAGKLLGKGKIQVAGEPSPSTPLPKGEGSKCELQAGAIILATGSEPTPLPFLPFDGKQIVSSTEALSFERVPNQLIVIGGGFIGLEIGSVWARLGSKVTVLEFLPRLLPLNDGDVAKALHKSLQKQGLDIHLETKVTGATKQAIRVTVHAEQDGKKVDFQGEKILVCVGRRPYADGLGLTEVGVQTEERSGRVMVSDKFETSVPGIFAIGDLIRGPMLAHKASEEGIAVTELIANKAGHVNYNTIPSVIYTHPEVAAVGLTEEQVKETGKKYKVGKFNIGTTGRAKCLDETEGFVKIIADADTDRILGMHVIGPRASDLIAEGVLAMEFFASAEDLARTCHAHPTLSEAVGEAARAAWAKAIQA